MKILINSIGVLAITAICFNIFKQSSLSGYIFYSITIQLPLCLIWSWIVDKVEK